MSQCCFVVDLRLKQTDDYAYAPSSAWSASPSLPPALINPLTYILLYISGLAQSTEMLTALISLALAISNLVLVNTIVMNGPDECEFGGIIIFCDSLILLVCIFA